MRICWRSSTVPQKRRLRSHPHPNCQTFYEGPDDVHIVGRNASRTAPAKFVVFLVKDKGAPILTPVK
jgi:hypothetical protein